MQVQNVSVSESTLGQEKTSPQCTRAFTSYAQDLLPETFDSEELASTKVLRCENKQSKKNVLKYQRENTKLEQEIEDNKKVIASLQKKLERTSQRESLLKTENRSLNRQLVYCKNFFLHLKRKVSNIPSRKLRKQILPLLSSNFNDTRRAPSASVSLQVSLRIDKRMKTTESRSRIRANNLRQNVLTFYERDNNSSTSPGAREFVTKKKMRKRKRYLTDTIDILYKKFRAEFPNIQIRRSLFFALRPFWVSNRKITSRDTCMCKEHANFALIFGKLRLLKLVEVSNVQTFIQNLCCDTKSKSCMFRECRECLNNQLPHSDSKQLTHYYAWVTEDVTRPGANNEIYKVKITSKKIINCIVSLLVSTFNSMVPKYLAHVYRNDHQFKTMTAMKDNLSEDAAYVLIDFSQNFIAKYSSEIHSAHFGASKVQISLQTGGFYLNKGSAKPEFESFALISDCLRHDAAAVWALLQPVLKRIRELKPNLKKIHFQSDGPTTQYKNKTNFFLLQYFSKELKLESATWNYSAPGHGKSPADGIGGNVKAMCDKAVSCGQDVRCAQDMANVIKSKESRIRAYVISAQDIKLIDDLITETVLPFPKTTLTFQLLWTNKNPDELSFRYLSCSQCISSDSCSHFELCKTSVRFANKNTFKRTSNLEKQFKVSKNDWVCVMYEDRWYPGQVTTISGKTLTVSFLSWQKKTLSWPAVPDEQKIKLSQVLCIIDAPCQMQTKNKKTVQFRMTEEQINFVDEAAKSCIELS